MHIASITLHQIRMPLKSPFAASYGVYHDRETILIEVQDESGCIGWGECVAFAEPWYTEETIGTAWHIMESFLIPQLLGKRLDHPREVSRLFAGIKRNPMAKAGLETAVWDLYAKLQGKPLAEMLGGVRKEIETGIAIGLQPTTKKLYEAIDRSLEAGYRRVKVKIKPGMDIDLIRSIRAGYPDLALMADANSAYTPADAPHLKRLDEYKLMMIEQPLDAEDIIDHAALQKQLATPICLDESLVSLDHVRHALTLGSCRVVNIKIGRVGGLSSALQIHDLCASHGVPVWCGGMLETGIGRAHNIALATLPSFTLPGDISASDRYWERDVISPPVAVSDGKIAVPEGPGIGVEVDREYLGHVTLRMQHYNIKKHH